MAITLETTKQLDDTGWKLLELLQENARLSYTELGKRLNLSAPAVAERVRQMEEGGVITGYRATVDIAKLGMPITAWVRVSHSGRDCESYGRSVVAHPEVMECHRVTGEDSHIIRVVVRSVEELEKVIDKLVPPFGNTTTAIELSTTLGFRPLTRRQ